ncbi:MAG TPA: sensor histidine kinase [Marinobacter sp.]|nr:sensor histidine kinase [Marinobacter sp.]
MVQNRRSDRTAVPVLDTGDDSFLPNLCSAYALFLWVLAGGLLALLLCVASSGLNGLEWATLGLVLFEVQWVILLSTALLCHLRPWLARQSALSAGLASYGLVLACALLIALIAQWFLQGVGGMGFDGWQVASHLVIAAIVAGMVLRFLFLQQQLYNRQQSELRSRIQALQSRIQPHFLFNSMNSIASLIATDPVRAERVVEQLSDLFRASLASVELVPLTRELDLCRTYLEIEQLRLDKRLEVVWTLPKSLPESLVIPGLLIQPLVENAIRHGIEPDPQGGKVEVSVHLNNKLLRIKVTNSHRRGRRRDDSHGNKMALGNIRHRLQAHFGKRAGLRLAVDNDYFTALVVIDRELCERPKEPQQESANGHFDR